MSGTALSVDFHANSSSAVQVFSFPLANGCDAGVETGVRVTGATVREGLPN